MHVHVAVLISRSNNTLNSKVAIQHSSTAESGSILIMRRQGIFTNTCTSIL